MGKINVYPFEAHEPIQTIGVFVLIFHPFLCIAIIMRLISSMFIPMLKG
jgi:hypothetical protein